MRDGVIYVHGRGGCAEDARRFAPLFPGIEVAGLDYRARTPWEAREEFPAFFDRFRRTHGRVALIADSIGAYFAMHALYDREIERACLISPIVDMEELIAGMMARAGVDERVLEKCGAVPTDEGELSWAYLSWVRAHPVVWRAKTAVLCGERDALQSSEAVRGFAGRVGASLTVMPGGEHWFHTGEQLAFLDAWLKKEISFM